MPYFFTLLMILSSFSVTAEIYTWQDEKGVTHFSQTEAEEQIEAMQADSSAADKFSQPFLIGKWTGKSGQTKHEWVFKNPGFFSIKQTSDSSSEIIYTGQWELDDPKVMLSVIFKSISNKSSGFVTSQNSADIIEHEKHRILISYNEEKFWLERN
ncbi:DUF4124 domain-containing protein [Psychromonas ossibalaenae]|uniref:DUF4124 domain-containing protein n=1 Tax=Psychromonas ossibalaenae TaxID=444922 RepID=UPI000364BB74|nr:DUF4124 domain-containing protein [Psychromonas ossibalaenae]